MNHLKSPVSPAAEDRRATTDNAPASDADRTDKLRDFWTRPAIWISATLFCVILWGTAFPGVKTGYRLFQINSSAPDALPSLLAFAGLRFFLAGGLTLTATTLLERKFPLPRRGFGRWKDIGLLALIQTVLQYSLFFLSLANTSGTVGSILSSTSAFMAVLLSGLFFRSDHMDRYKTLGCLLGLTGVVVLNLSPNNSGSLTFTLKGEGAMLLSSFFGALGSVVSKKMTTRNHPMALTGWQFLSGGFALFTVGFALGGRLHPVGVQAWLLLLYLGFLSATAFTLFTIMLKYHPVSRLTIFKALIPVIGTIGSGLILGEHFFEWRNLAALGLVVSGIIVLNRTPRAERV